MKVSFFYPPVWHCPVQLLLLLQWGEKAELLKESTSVIPFAAIISGKQQLPPDYYKEFLRLPYLTIIIGSVLAYLSHPYMQAGATMLHWWCDITVVWTLHFAHIFFLSIDVQCLRRSVLWSGCLRQQFLTKFKIQPLYCRPTRLIS